MTAWNELKAALAGEKIKASGLPGNGREARRTAIDPHEWADIQIAFAFRGEPQTTYETFRPAFGKVLVESDKLREVWPNLTEGQQTEVEPPPSKVDALLAPIVLKRGAPRGPRIDDGPLLTEMADLHRRGVHATALALAGAVAGKAGQGSLDTNIDRLRRKYSDLLKQKT